MSERIDVGMRGVLHLAWPAILSYVLNNAYRINDQFWVQDLGPEAHAAIGASTPILILNFAVVFLAVGGTLPLVARAVGAGRRDVRDDVIRHGLALGLLIAVVLAVIGWLATPLLARTMEADAKTAELTVTYLRTIYLLIAPLVLAPIVDNTFIGLGDTRVPMILQAIAVGLNLVLNPLLIYGLGSWGGLGIAGAAVATCASRALSAVLGILALRRLHGVRLTGGGRPRPERLLRVARLGVPMALTIALFAGVYVVLVAVVLRPLGRDVLAGFGIGFNAFETVSFPFFLGIALAGSSLVGRCLGARDEAGAWQAVRNVRRLGRLVGLVASLLFWFGGRWLAPFFTEDPGVLEETIRYVSILAFSQFFVAEEIVGEKVLYGAGHPRAILWISAPANLLRIPLAWLLSQPLGLSAAGVWWTINATTYLKAALYHRAVQRGGWTAPIESAESAPPRDLPSP